MKLYGNDPAQPNFARPEYIAREPDLQLLADEIGGTRTMWLRSTTYIRKWSAEKIGNYNIRRQCETFFEGFGRTLSAAIGMLFAQSPVLEWNKSEEAMTEQWDNIDGAGANGPVFVKRFSEAALRDGLSLIFVDHSSPPAGTGEVTAEMMAALGLRPFWRRYDRLQIINWLVENINNQATLTQLTLVESGTERVGRFGTRPVIRYRDLRLDSTAQIDGKTARVASWSLRQLNNANGVGGGTVTDVGSGTFRDKDGNTRPTLPVAIAYTGRTDAPMEASIPLLGVAWANLSHWQLSTDLRFNTLVAAFAQPTVIGDLVSNNPAGVPAALEIGPLVSVNVAAGGDFKWVEAAGTGLERLALLVLEKLKQMAALGVSFLMSDTRAAETAEAKRLDAAAENATLATSATGIQDAVNLALEIHAWYLGIEKVDAPVMTISHDFEATVMPADVMQAYIAAMKEGLPPRVLLEAFQAGGRIGPDVKLDDLEAEIMGNIAAAEKQKQLQLAALQANNNANAPGGNGNAPPPPTNGKPPVPPSNARKQLPPKVGA